MATYDRCFACDRPLNRPAHTTNAITEDGQLVYVGADCIRKIRSSRHDGFVPVLGGPRLYTKPVTQQ